MTVITERVIDPYVGPRPFTVDESDRFFGRDTETRALRALLYANRVVVLHAPSGSGKTSMVHAGLFPELTPDGDFEVLPVARVGGVDFTVEVDNPFAANTIASWNAVDADGSGSLAEALAIQPHRTSIDGLPALRLVTLDQFEELFTWYAGRWQRRREFMVELREALVADPQLRVLIVIRDDYLGQLDPLLGELGNLSRANLRLDLLRRDAALAAVEGPLAQLGVSYGEGVAEQLVDELMQIRVIRGTDTVLVPGEMVEPVQLQVVCEALWRNLPSGVDVITTEHWRSFGDVGQALTDFYLDSLERATADHDLSVEGLNTWIAENLVTAAATRATVFREENESAGMSNDVLEDLENLHVIRGEERLGGRWYELNHDRLIEAVTTISNRLGGDADRRQVAQLRRFLKIAAALAVLALVTAFFWSRTAAADAAQAEAAQAEAAAAQAEAEANAAQAGASAAQAEADAARTVAESDANAAREAQAAAASATLAARIRAFSLDVDQLADQAESIALADPKNAEEVSETDLVGDWNDLGVEAEDLAGQAFLLESRIVELITEDADSGALFQEQYGVLTDLINRLSGPAPIGGQAEAIEQIGELVNRSGANTESLADTEPTLPQTDGPAFDVTPDDQVILFGLEGTPAAFLRNNAVGSFADGVDSIDVSPDVGASSYIEVPATNRGTVAFTIDVPDGNFSVWALVNTSGQTSSDSMHLLVDRIYWIQNVAAEGSVDLLAQADPSAEVVGQITLDETVTACTDAESAPIVQSFDGEDWYRVTRPGNVSGSCQAGSQDAETAWVPAINIAWQTWDIFEASEFPTVGWEWDEVSARCSSTDTFTVHSCANLAPSAGTALSPGQHLITLRGREAGTRVAAIVVHRLPE